MKKDNTTPTFKCVLCDNWFFGYGNNPAPVSRTGRCCNDCDMFVIMSRMHLRAGIGRDPKAPLKLA